MTFCLWRCLLDRGPILSCSSERLFLLRFCFLKGQGKGSEEVLHFLSCLFENYIFKLVFHLSFLYFFSCLFEDYILILLYFLSCLFEDYIFKFVFLLYIFSAAYLRMQAVITQLVILCIGQFTAYCSVSPVETAGKMHNFQGKPKPFRVD